MVQGSAGSNRSRLKHLERLTLFHLHQASASLQHLTILGPACLDACLPALPPARPPTHSPAPPPSQDPSLPPTAVEALPCPIGLHGAQADWYSKLASACGAGSTLPEVTGLVPVWADGAALH